MALFPPASSYVVSGASELVIGHLRLPVSSTRIFRSFLETISDSDNYCLKKTLKVSENCFSTNMNVPGLNLLSLSTLARSSLRQKTPILTVSPRRRFPMISTLGLPSVFPNQLHHSFWTENWFPLTSWLLSSVMFV